MTVSYKITQKVIQFIQKENLPPISSRLIVGVSGGRDSVVLLHLLHHIGYECIVAHCNFQLRGTESDSDEQFVERLTQQMQLPFEHIAFNTKQEATRKGISIEMAARDLRYAWFEKLQKKLTADAIAVGHHSDDAIETFFINILRGTGIRGLTGIEPKNQSIIRPLLCLSRTEIEQYAQGNHLEYCIDSTNEDQSIQRNKIRHQLIPLMEQMNPSFRKTMQKNMERLAETYMSVHYETEHSRQRIMEQKGELAAISIQALLKETQPHFTLFELLHPFHFNSAIIQSIYDNLNDIPGKQFYSSSHRLIKDREQLLILPIHQEHKMALTILASDSVVNVDNFSLEISQPIDKKGIIIEKEHNIIFADADQLQFPLTIRHPVKGDYFYPFGSKGKKKLSDFFIDHKWNLYQKENCWLLCSNDTIMWIIGHRFDDRFKISEATKKVIKIRIL